MSSESDPEPDQEPTPNSPLPIGRIDPGTTLVVGSTDLERAQSLGTFLISMGCNEGDGVLFTTTDTPSEAVLSQCSGFDLDPDVAEVQLIDGTGADRPEYDIDIEELSSGDLTDLSIKFSVLYDKLTSSGCPRVLASVHTLSAILNTHDLRDSVRFLNSVSSRIKDGGGLLVFVVDASAHDQETLNTLGQVCDGLIQVRAGPTPEENQIRAFGIPEGPDEWLTVPAPQPRE
jgi:KaiC/GvpD/RAD55 family RecA-like ATPase